MEVKVKTLNEDGSIAFDGILRDKEVAFVLEVGVNFLLANGAQNFMGEDDDDDEVPEVAGNDTVQ